MLFVTARGSYPNTSISDTRAEGVNVVIVKHVIKGV